MSLLDDIKRDREAGTPGPWNTSASDFGVVGDISTSDGDPVAQAQSRLPVRRAHADEERIMNARRIARVPDMEAALLAAEALAEAVQEIARPKVGPDFDWSEDEIKNWRVTQYRRTERIARAALAAYRAATGDA